MHTKTRHPSVGQLSQAKQGFDRWRRGRKRSRRIPEPLWRMAAEAASIHGVHATARELRLNATRLKAQLRSLGHDRASEKTPDFVEIPWLGATPVSECILEAEDGDGSKLRIHLKGEAISQAVSLSHMLWKG
jgi:hypothetical protein